MLEQEFVNRLESVMQQAANTPLGGDAAWAAMLLSHGVEPIARRARDVAVGCGFTPTHGVLPVEVRRVFSAIRNELIERSHSKLRELRAQKVTDNVLHPLSKFGERSRVLMDAKLASYVDSIRPKATLAGIFSNAAITSLNHGAVAASVRSVKCKCCGAARPEGTDLGECAFCGNPIFNAESDAAE